MPSPFLDEVRRDMRLRGYSIKTEKTYLHWIVRYIYFIERRHPAELLSNLVYAHQAAFLTD